MHQIYFSAPYMYLYSFVNYHGVCTSTVSCKSRPPLEYVDVHKIYFGAPYMYLHSFVNYHGVCTSTVSCKSRPPLEYVDVHSAPYMYLYSFVNNRCVLSVSLIHDLVINLGDP